MIFVWILLLTLLMSLSVWISARTKGIELQDFFRLYGWDLLLLYGISVILIVYIVGAK